MKKLVQPQELEVFYLIPALRREMTQKLINIGKDQKEIAKLLQVSEPSISHYVNSQRAVKVQFNENINTQIMIASKKLDENKDVIGATQKLIKLLRDERTICNVCHEVNKEQIFAGCKVCFE